MDKDNLISLLVYGINKSFETEIPTYSYLSFNECYYGCHNDIKKIGKGVLKKLNIDYNNPTLDKMISNDYFVFNYKNMYIIINFTCDIWEIAKYQIIIVKNRREALIHRYGE